MRLASLLLPALLPQLDPRAAQAALQLGASGAAYKLRLPTPLGIAFEEKEHDAQAGVVVAALVAGGNAERDGRVHVGDELLACSAVVLGGESALLTVGGGAQYTNWKRQIIPCTNIGFDEIMAALGSNSGRFGYTDVLLELRHTADSKPGAFQPASERQRLVDQPEEEWDARRGTSVNGKSTPLRAPRDDFDW